jgi:hypothetical protein
MHATNETIEHTLKKVHLFFHKGWGGVIFFVFGIPRSIVNFHLVTYGHEMFSKHTKNFKNMVKVR